MRWSRVEMLTCLLNQNSQAHCLLCILHTAPYADTVAESEQLGTLPHMHLHTAQYADTLAESEQLGTLPHMHLAHCHIC